MDPDDKGKGDTVPPRGDNAPPAGGEQPGTSVQDSSAPLTRKDIPEIVSAVVAAAFQKNTEVPPPSLPASTQPSSSQLETGGELAM